MKALLSVFFCCLLAGCASKTVLEVKPEDWTFKDRAIQIYSSAPADLNSISGRPHSLMIGVFQINDPNTFQGLSATRDGAIKLLNEGRIDNTIAQFNRLIMQPGEERSASYSRAKGAMYVGIISGYYGLNTDLDVYISPIPVKPAKRGALDIILSSLGLIADEARAVPDEMFIEVSLGRNSTREVKLVEKRETRILR